MGNLSVEYNALNYMETAMAPCDADFKAAVMADTWGHLAPEKNRQYPGFILFSLTAYGDYILLDAEFVGLSDSPWLHDALMDFVEKKARKEGTIYRFEGAFRNYKFAGKVKRLAAKKVLHG